MPDDKKLKRFNEQIKNEIFTFTKKDDKGILSFHSGQLTIASIFKIYY